MAVFISPQLRPTSPNAAYTRLGYVVSSSNTDLPQYQYVLDVYESGSSNMISRLVQTPNIISSGSFYLEGVFDPSRIFQGELDFDNNWKVTGSIGPVNAVKTFELKAGEQYSTSISSSITVYPDQDTATITVFPAVINPTFVDYDPANNEWDFNTSSFDYNNPIPALRSQYLTNQPSNREWDFDYGDELYMNSEDYFTVTQLKDVLNTGSIRINACYYDGNTMDCITGSEFTFPGEGDFYTFGLGPKNLADWSQGYADLINSGSINFIASLSDGGNISYWIKDNLVSNTTLSEPVPCGDEYTRFAFINRYGFWDYYNVYNPVRTTTALERQNYNPTQLSYQYGFQTRYNPFIPQHTQYFLRSKDSYVIDTDYIDKETANWLEELLESPEVYIQEGSDFVPIVITNSSYEHNNSTSRNKLFQYTIEWVYANPRRSRL